MRIFDKFVPILSKNINSEEIEEIERFTQNIFDELRVEEKALMAKLQLHHQGTLTHSIMVAKDVEYIATKLGIYTKEQIKALTIAAILHDSGKLLIHDTVLDLGGRDEQKKIWNYNYPNKQFPEKPMETITVKDLINYKVNCEAKDKNQYIYSYLEWMKDKEVYQFLNQSLWAYIQYHQEGTKIELEKIGVSSEIINYAAAHHPTYFTENDRGKLPKEIKIIEIADRYNAIMQTEGIRNYAVNKKTKTEAMLLIIETLKKLFKNPSIIHKFFSTDFEGKIIEILAEEYFKTEDISGEIFEKVKNAKIELEQIQTIENQLKLHVINEKYLELEKQKEEFKKLLLKDIYEDEKLLALLVLISSFKNFDEEILNRVKTFDEEILSIIDSLLKIKQNEFPELKKAA